YRFPDQPWVVHRRYFRNDLEDTLQVGMVTYTDWDKAATYETTFHNSHVLNNELDPDPSSNPGLPFAPDIITRYDYIQWLPAVMPVAWTGLNLTDEDQVSDEEFLTYFGSAILTPEAPQNHVWLGGSSENWSD